MNKAMKGASPLTAISEINFGIGDERSWAVDLKSLTMIGEINFLVEDIKKVGL